MGSWSGVEGERRWRRSKGKGARGKTGTGYRKRKRGGIQIGKMLVDTAAAPSLREIASQISRENYPIVSGPTLPLCQPRISSPGLHNRLFVSPFYPCRSSAAETRPAVRPSFSPSCGNGGKEGRERKSGLWIYIYIVNFSPLLFLDAVDFFSSTSSRWPSKSTHRSSSLTLPSPCDQSSSALD